MQGVEAFENESLRSVRTREPATAAAIMQTELARSDSLEQLGKFDLASLRRAETAEKNPLPSPEVIQQEMEHIKFKVNIRVTHASTADVCTLEI